MVACRRVRLRTLLFEPEGLEGVWNVDETRVNMARRRGPVLVYMVRSFLHTSLVGEVTL
jgi:hypothetical protein